MNLPQFLHVNEHCPVCNEPLSLFAQVVNGPLWKAKRPAPGILHFDQFECKTNALEADDFFWLDERSDDVLIDFSTSRTNQAAKTWTMFFFYLCNPKAIEDVTKTNYGINPYVACYYRSTPFLELRRDDGGNGILELKEVMGQDPIPGDIRDEIFTLKDVKPNDDEKVYVLSFDYEVKNTTLRYYQITPEDRKNKYFDRSIFKKDLPLLSVRPNFELKSREQLINRLNTWVLLS